MHRKFHMKMRKNFVWVTTQRNRLPREGVKSPSLVALKNHLDAILSNAL